MNWKTPLVAMAALAMAPFAANATPITYFGEDLGLGEGTVLPATPNADAAQADFLSSLINPGVETFEGIADGTGAPLPISFPGAGTTATITGSGNVVALADGVTNGVGRYGVTGDADNDERFWEATSTFGLTFDNPVAAFGFYGIDIGDFGGRVTATTSGGLSQTFTIPNTINGPGGSVLFWGVIDPANTWTSVSFGNTASGTDYFAFDDFTVASTEQVQVPAPAPLALIGAGLLVMAGFRRRRMA
ncbi:MAG TPA: PEP-CTERM sorting domain-containing protein [Gammaproteobacteria bacterium]|nr:PEP-CTERM sorting domain-containing protein [Gammaproteobacteria bacterium]